MFTPNSTPPSHKEVDCHKYLDTYYAWLARISSDSTPLQILRRLSRILRLQLLPKSECDNLIFSLRLLAKDIDASLISKSGISDQLRDIETRIHQLCPRCLLISKMSAIENDNREYGPLIQSLFSRFEDNSFSKFQAEAIMRDLATTSVSNIEELEEIFDAWL